MKGLRKILSNERVALALIMVGVFTITLICAKDIFGFFPWEAVPWKAI